MKSSFPLAALPALVLRGRIRRFCTARVAASPAPPATLPSGRATATPEAVAAAAPPKGAAVAGVAAACPQAAAAAGNATKWLPAFGFSDSTPAEIVMHAQRLALSSDFTWVSIPAATGGASHNEEGWCSSAGARGFFSAKEQQLRRDEQPATYSTTTAAAAAASWGDLVFRAHGILHAFSSSHLVLLLRSMAAAGPISLARCSRSPMCMKQHRLQTQQLHLYLQKQKQQQLTMQRHCMRENRLVRENNARHPSGRSTTNERHSNSIETWNSHCAKTGSRNSHSSSRVYSVSCTNKCGRIYNSSNIETSSVSSGAVDVSNTVDSTTSSSLEKSCIVDTSTVSSDGDSVHADIPGILSNLGASHAPCVFSHQMQGRSVDFLEALINRLCAEHVVEQLSIDELAAAINSLHLLQYAHPLLVRRLRDARLPPTPESHNPFSAPLKVGLVSGDSASNDSANIPNDDDSSDNNDSIRSGINKSSERGHIGSRRGGNRPSGGSSRTALASEDSSSSVAGRSSSSDSSTGGDNSRTVTPHSSATTDRQVNDRVGTANACAEPNAATPAAEQKHPNTQGAVGREATLFNPSRSGSSRRLEAEVVTMQQQYQTPSRVPAGLLADKVAALLSHLNRAMRLTESKSSNRVCSRQQNSTYGRGGSKQLQLGGPQPEGKILANQATVVAAVRASPATSNNLATLPVLPGVIMPTTRAVEARTTLAAGASAEMMPTIRTASSSVPLKWMGKGEIDLGRTPWEGIGFIDEVPTAAAASTRKHCVPDLPRLTRIWHSCCSMGLLCPQLVSHVLDAFDKSKKSLKAEVLFHNAPHTREGQLIYLECCSPGLLMDTTVPAGACLLESTRYKGRAGRFAADLLFLVRAGAMHLTRQPLLHRTVIPDSALLLLLPSRNTGFASGAAGDAGVFSEDGTAAEGTRAGKAVLAARASWEHSKNRQITLKLGKVKGKTLIGEESRGAQMIFPHALDKLQEAAIDAAVSELINRSLRDLQEKMISLDVRHIALLLEAFALASFSPEPLTSDLLERHVLPRVASLPPEAVTSIVSSLSALDIRYDDLLQALSHRACEAISQYSPSALARLTLDMAKLNYLAPSLLSEVVAHMEELEASLSCSEFAELGTLLGAKGLRQRLPNAPA